MVASVDFSTKGELCGVIVGGECVEMDGKGVAKAKEEEWVFCCNALVV